VVLGKDRIMLHSPQRHCAQLELRLGREARIIGVVDAEIRPITCHQTVRMPHRSAAPPKSQPLFAPNLQTNLKDLLRSSRLRVGLSFRDASGMSRWIASTLSDEQYFAAPSSIAVWPSWAQACIKPGVLEAGLQDSANLFLASRPRGGTVAS
jgi:hypothetical protein